MVLAKCKQQNRFQTLLLVMILQMVSVTLTNRTDIHLHSIFFINNIKTMKHSQSTKSDNYKCIGCNNEQVMRRKTKKIGRQDKLKHQN